MVIFIVYFIALGIFANSPLIAKLFILGINSFFPDPVPYIDEVFMVISTIMNINNILECYMERRWLFYLGISVVIVVIIGFGYIVFFTEVL